MGRKQVKFDSKQRTIEESIDNQHLKNNKHSKWDNSINKFKAKLRLQKHKLDTQPSTAKDVEKYQQDSREYKKLLEQMPSDSKRARIDEHPDDIEFDEPAEGDTAEGGDLPNMDQDQDMNDMGGSPGAAMSAAGGAAPAGLMGGGGAGGGSMRGASELPAGVFQTKTQYIRKYKKQYSLRLTWDNIKYFRAGDDIQGEQSGMQFPVYEIPWEYLGMYLTKDEIHEIYQTKTRAVVKRCKVDIHNFTAILNFDVGSSVATVGNNNVGFRAAIMRNQRGKRMGHYNQNCGEIIANVFWGNHALNLPASASFTDVGLASLGAWLVTRNYDLRFIHFFQNNLNQIGGIFPNNYNPTAFNWKSFFNNRRNVSMNEGHWHSVEYKPKQGYITGREALSYFAEMLTTRNLIPGTLQNDIWLENINKIYQTTCPETRLVNLTGAPTANYNYGAPDTSTLPNTPSNNGFSVNGGANILINNPFPTTNASYVPGGANIDTSFGSMPAQFHVPQDDYKFLRVDNNHFMSKHHINDSNIPQESLAIALDLLINNTAENQTIQGWMEIILDCELDMEITEGQVAPFYPQGQSGSYRLCHPMPATFNPVMEIAANKIDTAIIGAQTTVGRSHLLPTVNTVVETATPYRAQKSWRETNLTDLGLTTEGQVRPNVSLLMEKQIQTRSMTKAQMKEKETIEKQRQLPMVEDITDVSSDESETEKPKSSKTVTFKHMPNNKDKNYIQTKLKYNN